MARDEVSMEMGLQDMSHVEPHRLEGVEMDLNVPFGINDRTGDKRSVTIQEQKRVESG